MENKIMVKPETLTGYRQPTESEKKNIMAYMKKYLKTTRKLFLTLFIISSVMAFIMLINIFTVSSSYPVGQRVAVIIITVLLACFAFYCREVLKETEIKNEKIENGQFQVLDCLAYAVEQDLNGNNTAVAKIYCDELYCDQYFPLNLDTLNQWKNNPQYPFVLMRCDYFFHKEKLMHELFTESKLKEYLKEDYVDNEK